MTIQACHATTIADSLRKAYPFGVEMFRLSGPDNMRTPFFGLFRSDTGESVGDAVRSGYVPHTREDVVALAEAAAATMPAGDWDVICHWRDGHNVIVGPSIEKRRAIFGSRDNIFPRFVIRAGYDGHSFRASLGFFRDACQNMVLLRPEGVQLSCRIRHTAGLRGRMDELIDSFRGLANGWDNLADIAAAMDDRAVRVAEFLRQVRPLQEDATERQRGSWERWAEAVVRRIDRERLATGRPVGSLEVATAWEAFNAVQGFAQHDSPRRGKVSAADRIFLAADSAEVRRAAELATAA